jgi:hypothetical protein
MPGLQGQQARPLRSGRAMAPGRSPVARPGRCDIVGALLRPPTLRAPCLFHCSPPRRPLPITMFPGTLSGVRLGARAGAVPARPDPSCGRQRVDSHADGAGDARGDAGLPGALRRTIRRPSYLACLLHDVAKPMTTKTEEGGRVTAKGTRAPGRCYARRLLWELGAPFALREMVCGLIRYHQIPSS